jgi:NB-ARC domain-containing protein
MSPGTPGIGEPAGNTGIRNKVSGGAPGIVVQSGSIRDIHVHSPLPDRVVPQQLPGVAWHFTGRATELATMTALLDEAGERSGTVVISPADQIPGIGTTALATRWARDVAHRFPDGALYVNLRGSDPTTGPVITPEQVIRGFLDAFGVAVPAGGLDALVVTYRSVLAHRRVLLLLDDARDAEQVRPLLPGTSSCWVVVTSRRPLPNLVATEGARPLTLRPLTDEEARELLERHIGAQRRREQASSADELIWLTGGIPLALNIMAAHAAARPGAALNHLVAELRAEQRWLGQPANPGVHDRLRTVFSWTHQSADTQALPARSRQRVVRDSAIAWTRSPRALIIAVAAILAVTVAGAVVQSLTGQDEFLAESGYLGISYLVVQAAVLIAGVVLLARTGIEQVVGAGIATGMAIFMAGDAAQSLHGSTNVWIWLNFVAVSGYLIVLAMRLWPQGMIRRKPRFVSPANRPFALVVLAAVAGQLILLFVAVPYDSVDGLGDTVTATFSISAGQSALAVMLFVAPVAGLCVYVALTEPLDTRRRAFVVATLFANLGPELLLLLGSLVLGDQFTYIGDDAWGPGVHAAWFVVLQSAVHIGLGVGTLLLTRPSQRTTPRATGPGYPGTRRSWPNQPGS